MSDDKLPPLHTTYKPYADEFVGKTELKMERCKHDLYLVSTTEARCRKCSIGFTGNGIIGLVQKMKE